MMFHGTATQWLAEVALIIPVFLLTLSVHEFAHALVATLLGDDTAKRSGRLTLNPLAHIDFYGLMFLIFVRIGWAKPVPFNQYNFKYPRLYSVLVALAGPASNFILTLLTFVAIKYFPVYYFSPVVTTTVLQLLWVLAYISTMLGVFNLLPIPPLDGSHILMVTILRQRPEIILWFYRYSIFILLFLFYIPHTRMAFFNIIKATEMFLYSLVF